MHCRNIAGGLELPHIHATRCGHAQNMRRACVEHCRRFEITLHSCYALWACAEHAQNIVGLCHACADCGASIKRLYHAPARNSTHTICMAHVWRFGKLKLFAIYILSYLFSFLLPYNRTCLA
jgi:hypothetical protein